MHVLLLQRQPLLRHVPSFLMALQDEQASKVLLQRQPSLYPSLLENEEHAWQLRDFLSPVRPSTFPTNPF